MSNTPLDSLIEDLRIDINDPDLDDVLAQRALARGLAILSLDVSIIYAIIKDGDDLHIEPALPQLHRELLLMLALSYLVRIKHSSTTGATTISFRSGDKQVSRTSASVKKLERTILDEYLRLLKKTNPHDDDDLLYFEVQPVIYSQGSVLE